MNMKTVKSYQNKKWLYNKYINEKLSTYQIAKLWGISGAAVCYWLIKYNIPRRWAYANTNNCNLSQKAIEWINGELLGDGFLRFISLYSAQFMYSSKHLEYIKYISETLESFGIKQSGRIRKRIDKKYNSHSWDYQSLCYPEFLPIRKKWYPNNKKIIPRDIKLTPLTLKQFFIGDGCLLHPKIGNPYIVLATNGFPFLDVEWLVIQLIKLGFEVKRQQANSIYIFCHSTKDFLDYIGKCPVKCYQYKFNY